MCKKHTRDAEIRPFCPEFCQNSVWILSFSEKCKNQGSFCKCFIINKNAILHLTEHGGSYENGACFYQPPVFVWKIYPQNSYLANLPCVGGGEVKMLASFLSSPNGLFRFLPTFYPQKSSILTEVMGEDKKTLTIFSSLIKILWSFFHKTASQGLLCCSLPLTRTLP